MVTTDDKSKVEPGEFAWIEKPWAAKTFKNQPYAKASGCNRCLEDATTDFSVTAWGLARLLGLPWLHHIYQWLDGRKRPSQMYMTRLVKLYQLHNQGISLAMVHHIDWDGSGEIHLKERVNVSGTGGVSPKRRKVSAQESENRNEMAKFFAQSPR